MYPMVVMPRHTISVERVRELIATDLDMREIADALGCSRHGLYLLCRRHKIDYERHRHQKLMAEAARTGIGYTATHMKGTAAEMLVAASLLLKMWEVYVSLNRTRGHDLIVVKDQRMLSVEVRLATREKATGRAICRRDHKSDILAIVCDGEITFEPALPL